MKNSSNNCVAGGTPVSIFSDRKLHPDNRTAYSTKFYFQKKNNFMTIKKKFQKISKDTPIPRTLF